MNFINIIIDYFYYTFNFILQTFRKPCLLPQSDHLERDKPVEPRSTHTRFASLHTLHTSAFVRTVCLLLPAKLPNRGILDKPDPNK